MSLRPDLQLIVDALLAGSESSREISLDAIGDAIGPKAVSAEDVDAIMTALESRGRHVVGPSPGNGEERLGKVIEAARALGSELGRRPNVIEIAARSGLTIEEVRHALGLARVMQR
jgi:hypothetical protein